MRGSLFCFEHPMCVLPEVASKMSKGTFRIIKVHNNNKMVYHSWLQNGQQNQFYFCYQCVDNRIYLINCVNSCTLTFNLWICQKNNLFSIFTDQQKDKSFYNKIFKKVQALM